MSHTSVSVKESLFWPGLVIVQVRLFLLSNPACTCASRYCDTLVLTALCASEFCLLTFTLPCRTDRVHSASRDRLGLRYVGVTLIHRFMVVSSDLICRLLGCGVSRLCMDRDRLLRDPLFDTGLEHQQGRSSPSNRHLVTSRQLSPVAKPSSLPRCPAREGSESDCFTVKQRRDPWRVETAVSSHLRILSSTINSSLLPTHLATPKHSANHLCCLFRPQDRQLRQFATLQECSDPFRNLHALAQQEIPYQSFLRLAEEKPPS